MTDDSQPREEFVREERCLEGVLVDAALVIGGGAVTGVTGALASHWLEGKADATEPPPPHVELPPGVHVDDD
jgi:hypothetical protein